MKFIKFNYFTAEKVLKTVFAVKRKFGKKIKICPKRDPNLLALANFQCSKGAHVDLFV